MMLIGGKLLCIKPNIKSAKTYLKKKEAPLVEVECQMGNKWVCGMG